MLVPYCLSLGYDSEFGDLVATSQSLEVEDAVAFADSVAAIRRHMEDGTSNENVFEVCCVHVCRGGNKSLQVFRRVYFEVHSFVPC